MEVLNEIVRAEIEALPEDIRARLAHIIEMMVAVGPDRMRAPHVKPLRDKLWEMRMHGAMASRAHSIWRSAGGAS